MVELRWAVTGETTTKAPLLQYRQLPSMVSFGGPGWTEWQDVPWVVVPEAPQPAPTVLSALGVAASADGWIEAGLVCQACAGDAPGGKCRNPKCVGGPIVRELVPAEKDVPSPIPHPLPAQANDGGEHG